MANLTRTFVKGRMNKEVTERLVPSGEYIDALNVRLNSTEEGDVGAIENSKGNELVIALEYKGEPLSESARCIGAYKDSANETLYWFVHDPLNSVAAGTVDLVVSYNVSNSVVRYHLISETVLNFNPAYLITGISMVEDLLFWTDNINPPRKINVNRAYPEPTLGVDGFDENDISVIVKPPAAAPDVQLTNVPGDENFLEDKFVSFAYRYKYRDGEYSALSQFSEVAFQPNPFEIDDSQVLNVGMTNFFNSCSVSFDTGPEEVVGIDVVFKISDDPVIRVINKYIKEDENWADNSTQSIQFTNSQIYTILPEDETLRLYDNVPLLAKAQTIMGNRLMYGNYVEGYDLVDSDGNAIDLCFSTGIVSTDIGYEERIGSVSQGLDYPISGGSPLTVVQSQADFDFSGIDLTAGSAFQISISFAHDQWSNSTPFGPEDVQDPFTVSFFYQITQDYANVYDLVNSASFQSQVGTPAAANYEAATDCSDGSTLTDVFSCQIVPPTGWTIVGRTFPIGILLSSDPSSPDTFGLQFPGMYYLQAATLVAELFKIVNVELVFLESSNSRSLHSNRDFELGIIYMDDYNRSTTALVSNTNTVFIPASASDTANNIRVTIPYQQRPPFWATKYKFALKPTKTFYQTIYSVYYYNDPNGNGVWVKLDGENQRKVEAGDELIVKTDVNGPLNSLVNAVVLDKETFQRDDIVTNSLPGVYARFEPVNYLITPTGQDTVYGCVEIEDDTAGNNPDGPYLQYEVTDFIVGVGSQVSINIKANRGGGGVSDNCGCQTWQWGWSGQAATSYTTFKDFWDAQVAPEGFDNALNECLSNPDDFGPLNAIYYSNVPNIPTDTPETATTSVGNMKLQFVFDTATSKTYLTVRSGIVPCTYGIVFNSASLMTMEICVQNTFSPVVFETKPSDALPDVFFEGSQVFDIVSGLHLGNLQDQYSYFSSLYSCISDLSFFDCFCFGNGVESYRAKDSILGKYFNIGQRVTTTSSQDYKQTRRFADITYSGVYNDESNINRLNEFNSGLLNFKALEDVYGPIQRMEGRETDILTLQEDKISYVLTGKDLLSDAGAGGALTSVPTVLGQQIARTEEYGISFNAESYAQFGYDKYFTDVKRGAVILLRGNSYSNESLEVVSKMGMRSFFRDLFTESIDTQKLGGYDPYTDEYVIHSNDVSRPIEDECIACGTSESIYVAPSQTITLCFQSDLSLGQVQAAVSVGSRIPSSSVLFTLSYNATDVSDTVAAGGSSTLSIDVNSPTVSIYRLTITDSLGDGAYVSYNVSCPEPRPMTIKVVTLSSNSQAGQTVTNAFNWRPLQPPFTYSPYYTEQVTFGTTTGQYAIHVSELTGNAGTGYFPTHNSGYNPSQVFLKTPYSPYNTYELDVSNYKTYYAHSSVDYDVSDPTVLNTLIANGTLTGRTGLLRNDNAALGIYDIVTLGYGGYSGTDEYVYIVFDYRKRKEVTLCEGSVSGSTPTTAEIDTVCCDCGSCSSCVSFLGTASLLPTDSTLCTTASPTVTYYHDGGSPYPKVGDRVYLNAECTKPAIRGVIAIELVSSPSPVRKKLRIGNNGLVTAVSFCNLTSIGVIGASYGYISLAEACSKASYDDAPGFNVGTFGGSLAVGSQLIAIYQLSPTETRPPLPPGYYKKSANNSVVYEVGEDGIILSINTC